MENLVIVGASGFAKEIRGLINRINDVEKKYNFIGFISNDLASPFVIGDDDYLLDCQEPIAVVIAIADPIIRCRLTALYKQNENISFPNIIDPSTVLMDNNKLGKGNIICAGTILTVDIRMGDFNIINLGCTIGHEAAIGNFVTLNPNVNISGNVNLYDKVYIGTGTQVLQGTKIGRNAILGAGAVVISDIPNDCTAVGIPAKIIKDRR